MHRQGDFRRDQDAPAELENQFILRLPDEPSNVLRDLVLSGVTNLKDRFTIRVDSDMRFGEVRVDHWLMPAKILDLPTIVESLKTIDNKSFYKTADVCQMMVCKEEADPPSATEEDSPTKVKKKDPNKVDKKFLWPHGITLPTKNVRRRRFRKTLKKKYVEAPEIEKEVKRLLRVDNECVNVKWEIISEDDDQLKKEMAATGNDFLLPGSSDVHGPSKPGKQRPEKHTPTSRNIELTGSSVDLAEHDIFGGAVSDSEEEEEANINVDLDDNSQLSGEDSIMSDSNSLQGLQTSQSTEKLITAFNEEMFRSPSKASIFSGTPGEDPSTSMDPQLGRSYYEKIEPEDFSDTQLSRDSLLERIDEVASQLQDLQMQRVQRQQEVDSMENLALKQRFQEMLDSVLEQIHLKKCEYEELQAMLHSMRDV